MSVRKEVHEFVNSGPLPESSAAESEIALRQCQLEAIRAPLTDEEAALLITAFGPDDCYGLAWALLHLIESAPGRAGVLKEPTTDDNEWVRRLWDRAQGADRQTV